LRAGTIAQWTLDFTKGLVYNNIVIGYSGIKIGTDTEVSWTQIAEKCK
jgi:hypothetical protein